MADVTKYAPINGRTLISDFKSHFSLHKTKRTAVYGFAFVFIGFTIFLAFTPSSNSSSPWFTNIFTSTASSSSSKSSISSDDSYRSHFSSFFSFFFPNSSTQVHNSGTRSKNTNFETPSLNIQPPVAKNQTQNQEINDKGKVSKKNNSTVLPKEPPAKQIVNSTSPSKSSSELNKESSIFKNQTQNKQLNDKTEELKANHSSIGVAKSPVAANQTANSSKKSDSGVKSVAGNGDNRTAENEWVVTNKNGTKKETLRLDIIGRSADNYKNADIIVFNTGHWWTHDKTSKGKDYYQEGSHVYSELNVLEAFRKALTTWGRWVDANVNSMKTLVFFRGYSKAHFSGGQWNSGGQCDHEAEPIKNETYLTQYPPKMTVLEKVLKGMKTPVTYLNITRMTDYRKDGHPSIYRKKKLSSEEKKLLLRVQDCSHWCLPGVPDAWNEILYAELLSKS
ncbi:protein trichome birefringence-like [Forsythia ovata]|uniref:Protein trichome birefringence-like n=1 Tax=Forsythia ovata TaxID=205694 RepID=A0ABD1PN04_9LAMI